MTVEPLIMGIEMETFVAYFANIDFVIYESSSQQGQRLILVTFDCHRDFDTCPQYFAQKE
jgi:hypothetical protein